MSQFKPMSAAKAELNQIIFPAYVAPKYDGIRAVVINGQVFSKNLKPIPNKHVQRLYGRPEYNGLDGELIVGDPWASDAFNKTSSGVMSIEGEPQVKFYVFDCFSETGSFERRYHTLKRICKKLKGVVVAPQCLVENSAALEGYEREFVAMGYEGIMIRSPAGLYKSGRSTLREGYLLKSKRFEDSEAKIIGYKQQMHNTNEATIGELGQTKRSSKKAGMVLTNLLGTFLVKDLVSGVEFEVGTGFSQSDREIYWACKDDLIGKIIKYSFQPAGVKEKPRFPKFLGFRDEIDL